MVSCICYKWCSPNECKDRIYMDDFIRPFLLKQILGVLVLNRSSGEEPDTVIGRALHMYSRETNCVLEGR